MSEININIPVKCQFLFKPKRFKVLYGGRAGAKSHSIARALIIKSMQSCIRIVCARGFQNSIKDSSKSLLEDIIKHYKLEKYFKITNTEIYCKLTGTLFIFKGLNRNTEDVLKSLEGTDIIWIEEANTIPKRVWNVLVPTIRKPKSEIWISYNPKFSDDPVHEEFVTSNVKRDDDDATVVKIGWRDNPYLSDELKKEIGHCRKYDPDKYQHVWEGEVLTISEAIVFSGKYSVEAFELPDDTPFRHGMDFGFFPDPAAVIRCYVDKENQKIFIDREAHGLRTDVDNLPGLIDKVITDGRDWPVIADSSRPDTISYLNKQKDENGKFKYNTKASKKGPNSVEEGISFLKSYKIIIHPRCKHTIYELGKYSYKVDKITEEIFPILVDKDNHFIDALRYATEGLRKVTPKVVIC